MILFIVALKRTLDDDKIYAIKFSEYNLRLLILAFWIKYELEKIFL